jgi:mono/diheme cytochrome c family protein
LSSRSRIWREGIVFAAAAVLFLTMSVVGFSQDADQPAQDSKPAAAPDAPKKGDEIFRARCIICHNPQPGDHSSSGVPDLFKAFKAKTITAAQAEQIIVHGKGQMPGWGTILSKSDIESVIAYLKTGK